MPITPRSSAAHVFVASLDDPELDLDDRHHLERVLRLRDGAALTLCDGRGRWRPAELGRPLTVVGDVVEEPAPSPPLVVAFALVKGDRPELVARALSEIGVDRIVPMQTARSVVRWSGERARSARERLRRVVRSASMQCRRLWLPEVTDVLSFGDAAAMPGAAMAVPEGAPVGTATTLLVGPEGGWSPEELGAGLPAVGLGPHVLRTETAAIVAGALLVSAHGGR